MSTSTTCDMCGKSITPWQRRYRLTIAAAEANLDITSVTGEPAIKDICGEDYHRIEELAKRIRSGA